MRILQNVAYLELCTGNFAFPKYIIPVQSYQSGKSQK